MSRLVFTTNVMNVPGTDYTRIRNYFESVKNSLLIVPEMKEHILIILVVMGEPFPDMLTDYWKSFVPNLIVEDSGVKEKRCARVVALIRNNAVEKYMKDDDLVCAFDDDYIFNAYAFKFIKMLFDDNPDINFLSVLKPWEQLKDVDQKCVVRRSSFNFWMTHNCMGGCSMYRWSEFKKYIYDYFKEFNVQLEKDDIIRHGSFDQTFFPYIGKKIGKPYFFHLMDFSLIQQIWHKSFWYEERGERPLHHTWGDRFDPVFDPFLIKELLEKETT